VIGNNDKKIGGLRVSWGRKSLSSLSFNEEGTASILSVSLRSTTGVGRRSVKNGDIDHYYGKQ